MIQSVDSRIDLDTLDWSETTDKNTAPLQLSGWRGIREPNFDFSLLDMGPDYREFNLDISRVRDRETAENPRK